MSNPLLNPESLPSFDQININQFESAVMEILSDNRRVIDEILKRGDFSWSGLVYPMEHAEDRLNSAWSVVSHYKSVLNSDELREIYTRLIA